MLVTSSSTGWSFGSTLLMGTDGSQRRARATPGFGGDGQQPPGGTLPQRHLIPPVVTAEQYRGDVTDAGSQLHPDLSPLQDYLGAWEGEGEGLWEGGFRYSDSLLLSADPHGRPIVLLHEQTFEVSGRAIHAESGYLLAKAGGEVHMLVSEPSGIAEVLAGRVTGSGIELTSVEIGHAPGAKNVTATTRRLVLDRNASGDLLTLETDIAVGGDPLAPHTRSVLHRS
ncbi:MAG TPA: heme-binding beta-barrel domain-containing protein [Acidimicrobiales bacterium]|nr:heme-binding beta-barrel domain-containing protein [Acidimicrobiales bacterium]